MEHYTVQQSLIVVGAVYFIFFASWSLKTGEPSWTYMEIRRTIDWEWVSIFVLLAMAAVGIDFIRKPFDSFLLMISMTFLFVWLQLMWLVQKSKEKKVQAVEKHSEKKVLYNLRIGIECGIEIRKTFIHSKEDEIERIGMAIHRAKKMLVGNWRVLEGGALARGFSMEEGVNKYTALIDIDECSSGLKFMEKVIAKKAQMTETSCRVHMHFQEGWPVTVEINENGLFIH